MSPHLSRRRFVGAAGAALLGGRALAADALASPYARPSTPAAALAALHEGNARYRDGTWTRRDYSPVGERRAEAQAPFAAILTCADSRVAPTLIFDVERGNLFCSHVAGNSAGPDTIGSIEYAVAVLEVPLVVVLGHSNCGAVKAAIEVAAGRKSYPAADYGAIGTVVGRVKQAVLDLPASQRTVGRCIRHNAVFQAHALAARRPIVREAIAAHRLQVLPAVYEIASGAVEFL